MDALQKIAERGSVGVLLVQLQVGDSTLHTMHSNQNVLQAVAFFYTPPWCSLQIEMYEMKVQAGELNATE